MKNLLLIFILLLSSCVFKKKEKTSLDFKDLKEERINKDLKKRQEEQEKEAIKLEFLRIKKLKELKKVTWSHIVKDAKSTFSNIKPIVKNKCFDCHDSNTKLPFYGTIFKEKNFAFKHQQDGLKALDFAGAFPMQALGSPTQLSLLKSIRDAVMDRTMPLKSYTFIYRWKKINNLDAYKILNWVSPLIMKIEKYNDDFKELDNDGTLDSMAISILKQKCFRCHANGASKGKFGGMQNIEDLLKNKKYSNLHEPDQSKLYTMSLSGEMPPSKREKLSEDEMLILLDWLKSKSIKESDSQ